MLEMAELMSRYRNDGYCVLPSVFSAEEIERFRAATLGNLGLMGKTRTVAHSYHLAGFHRFPTLAALHARIVSDRLITDFASACFGAGAFHDIGLSDITVNRSQHWHTDLLRGRYSVFLDDGLAWADPAGGCVKALIYLQDGASLQVVPGTHLEPSPLDDGQLESIAGKAAPVRVAVRAGDVVMMDIRLLHRGATDDEMARPELRETPKILYSTVFGSIGSAFSEAMRNGNVQRMADWDSRHLRAALAPTSLP